MAEKSLVNADAVMLAAAAVVAGPDAAVVAVELDLDELLQAASATAAAATRAARRVKTFIFPPG
jgi:hypothetical protein